MGGKSASIDPPQCFLLHRCWLAQHQRLWRAGRLSGSAVCSLATCGTESGEAISLSGDRLKSDIADSGRLLRLGRARDADLGFFSSLYPLLVWADLVWCRSDWRVGVEMVFWRGWHDGRARDGDGIFSEFGLIRGFWVEMVILANR